MSVWQLLAQAADLWTKAAVFRWRGLPGETDIWWVIDGYFGIETAVNIGAVFGVGAGKGTFVCDLVRCGRRLGSSSGCFGSERLSRCG